MRGPTNRAPPFMTRLLAWYFVMSRRSDAIWGTVSPVLRQLGIISSGACRCHGGHSSWRRSSHRRSRGSVGESSQHLPADVISKESVFNPDPPFSYDVVLRVLRSCFGPAVLDFAETAKFSQQVGRHLRRYDVGIHPGIFDRARR